MTTDDALDAGAGLLVGVATDSPLSAASVRGLLDGGSSELPPYSGA
jgi:hypothetical protein